MATVYLVFAGPDYYPSPTDFVMMTSNLKEAKDLCKKLVSKDVDGLAENDYASFWEVFDGKRSMYFYYREGWVDFEMTDYWNKDSK